MGKSRSEGATRPSRKKRSRSEALERRLADKVYKWQWEWAHFNGQGFNTIHKARDWVKWACELYGVPVPTVRQNRYTKDTSFFRPVDWSIHLLPMHWNLAVSLHEAAHAIACYYYGLDEGHTARWLGIFVWLLTNSGAWPKDAITTTLDNRGLKYSRMMTPKVLRRRAPRVRVV